MRHDVIKQCSTHSDAAKKTPTTGPASGISLALIILARRFSHTKTPGPQQIGQATRVYAIASCGPVYPLRVASIQSDILQRHGSYRVDYSQLSAPPVWYSITRVSKKFRSFFKSIISLIHGNGFSSCANIGSRPICCARRLAMKRKYPLNIGAFKPRTPRGIVSSA